MPKVILIGFIRTINMSRDSIHNRIDELLGLLSIHNSRLSLHTEKLSQLDIDVLRKQCIDLYDEVNMLALQGRIKTKEVNTPKVEEKKPNPVSEVVPPEVVTPKVHIPVKQIEEPPRAEVPAAPRVEEVIKSKPIPKVAKPEDEMLSLFEKFSSNPIDSIAKGMSVAKRFEFQSAFFDGDNKEYNSFMKSLDAAGSREAAFAIYHEHKLKRDWDNEELKDELKSLMYRKYA
jgi:hypothetical protein